MFFKYYKNKTKRRNIKHFTTLSFQIFNITDENTFILMNAFKLIVIDCVKGSVSYLFFKTTESAFKPTPINQKFVTQKYKLHSINIHDFPPEVSCNNFI